MATKKTTKKATTKKAAKPAEEQAPDQDAVKDDTPALASVAPQFDMDVPAGVDASTLPEFKDQRRMLPAQRARAQMDLASIATGLPDSVMDMAEGGNVSFDLRSVNSEDLDAVASVLETVQDMVLDNAQDREAMTDWLLDQKDGTQAVMYAFTKFQAGLGN